MALVLCFIPIIVAVLIFTLAFKLKITHQLIAILLGLAAVFPISIIQYLIPDLPFMATNPVLYSLLKSIIIYGLIEEVIKMVLLYPLPKKHTTPIQFLLLAFLMGLSLGCFESVVYFIDHLQRASTRGAQLIYSQIFIRIFTSDIIHMTCTGLASLFILSCRNKKAAPMCIITAIFLHGFYDFFAGFQTNIRWFSLAVILLALAECRLKYTTLFPKDE